MVTTCHAPVELGVARRPRVSDLKRGIRFSGVERRMPGFREPKRTQAFLSRFALPQTARRSLPGLARPHRIHPKSVCRFLSNGHVSHQSGSTALS